MSPVFLDYHHWQQWRALDTALLQLCLLNTDTIHRATVSQL